MLGAIFKPYAISGMKGLWLGLCLLGLTSCITVEGESSGQMKRKLENSFLFRSADLFYPDGVPDDPAALPELRRRQVREIEKTFDAFLGAVVKATKKQTAERSVLFGKRVPEDFRARLEVTDTGQPIAYVDPDGTVFIDVKIAQAIYRTALIASLRDNRGGFFGNFGNFGAFGFEEEQAPKTEADVISGFLEIKRKLEETTGRSIIGDIFQAFNEEDLFDSSFSVMADIAFTSLGLQQNYFGTIQFLIAHEAGHLALGHLEERVRIDPNDCGAYHVLEVEADVFALGLLYREVLEQGGAALIFPDSFFGIKQGFGFENFFEYTYELAEFEQTGSQCSHPDPALRLEILNRAYEAMQTQTIEAFNHQLSEAVAEELEATPGGDE